MCNPRSKEGVVYKVNEKLSLLFLIFCLFSYTFQNSHILLKFALQKLNNAKHGNE